MSDDNMERNVRDLLSASREESDKIHDIAMDALHEKEFGSFLQLVSESHVTQGDAIGVCDLWRAHRTISDIDECKKDVNDLFDEYEREYIDILNKMCGR